MKRKTVKPVRRQCYPLLNEGPYSIRALAYVDGIWLNPNNVTFIADAYEKPGQGDSTIQRIHFIGGEHVDVDGERDRVVWRIDSALALLQKEENKEGKENFPPAPPIEKREQTKEAPPPTRVRAGVRDDFLKQWKITEAFFQYWLKKTEGKKPRNPERSVHNYWTHRKTDKAWFEFLRDYEATQAKAEEKHYNLLGEVR